MNVLVLTEKYPPDVGGLAVSTRRLACGLSQAGHTVTVSVLDASLPPGAGSVCSDDGFSVQRCGAHRRADDTLSGWFDQVVALHAACPFDLIHALYVAQPAFVAVMAARFLGCRSVISARGNDLERTAFDPSRFAQVVWALQQADAVTAVSTELVRRAQALAPGREVHWIPNGVDVDLFAPGPRDEALAGSLALDTALVLAFVGEARRKKGLTVLLLAFARLCAQHDPLPSLLLVGGVRRDDAPVVEVFQRQNPALKLHVVPPVPHGELPAYYRLADLLVFPSLHDGMPNALLEGMACGRAVVASEVGGIADIVRYAEADVARAATGVLVPAGDAEALTRAMHELLSDPSRRARLGTAARAAVVAGFTPAQELERNLEVYRQVRGER